MATQEWKSNSPLMEALLEEFYGFSFFKAVHLLESLLPGGKPLGKALSPREEAVRFSVKPGFEFPPSDISNFKYDEKDGPAEMEVAFLGLIGPSGVLPHWYNEMAIERSRRKDHGLTSFLDIFHHRLVSLFYLAWKKSRFTVNYLPGAKDKHSGYLLSLLGLGTPGLTRRLGLPEEALIFYSGLLSRPVPSVVAIEAAVEYFSDSKVRVRQFVERLLPIDPEDQSRIGLANGRLGVDTVCGSFARECQTKFQVDLGPMSYARFIRFLPSGKMLREVFSLIRYMVGIEYEFNVGVILKREEVPPCVLGMQTPDAPRLGWSTWVKSPDVAQSYDPCVVFEEAAVS
jgi:type VI secretion system protein ImpH